MTKRKIALTIVSAVIAAILIVILSLIIVTHSRNDRAKPTAELADWMSMIDDALLTKIAITGAHDAGTKGMPYFAETQDAVLQLLHDTLRKDDILLLSQGSMQSDNSEFMKKVTLKEVRGRAIPFWGTETAPYFTRTDM